MLSQHSRSTTAMKKVKASQATLDNAVPGLGYGAELDPNMLNEQSAQPVCPSVDAPFPTDNFMAGLLPWYAFRNEGKKWVPRLSPLLLTEAFLAIFHVFHGTVYLPSPVDGFIR